MFFGSSISKLTEIHIQPTSPHKDGMRKNTNTCNLSLDDSTEPEEPVNTTMTTTSMMSEDNSNMTQESIGVTATSMSEGDNETWYNTIEEYDGWHDAIEFMDNYQ